MTDKKEDIDRELEEMEDLIREYKQGRADLRIRAREIRQMIESSTERGSTLDENDVFELKHSLSLYNGMIRGMTETIQLMTNRFYQLRGMSKNGNLTESKEIVMDPALLRLIHIPAPEEETEDGEDKLRESVLQELGSVLERRMDLLTNKQRSTLQRWVVDGKRIFEIAAEDGVTRQAIFQRLFGSKIHLGAVQKLRDGKGEIE